MSKVKPRVMTVKPHRAVDWNEKAIRAVIKERGFVLAGIKVDGMRCHVLKIDGEVHFLTRAGIEIPALAPYKEQFEQRWLADWQLADGLVLDCEVWLPSVSFEEGCGILRRDAPVAPGLVQFVVLDIITQAQLQGLPVSVSAGYVGRHAAIVGRFNAVLGDAGSVLEPHHPLIVSEALAKIEDFDDIKDAYTVARDIGFEGLVIKDPALHPRNGKVSGMWKVKPGCGADFAPGWEGDGKIVGYVWGDGEKANAGKIVGFRVSLEDGTEVNATGLTQAQMEDYTQAFRQGYDEDGDSATPFIGRYAEVTAMEKTASGSLRHPSFRRFRDLDSAPGVKA